MRRLRQSLLTLLPQFERLHDVQIYAWTPGSGEDKWMFFYFISPSLYYQFGHFSIFIAFANMKENLDEGICRCFFSTPRSQEKFRAFFTISHRLLLHHIFTIGKTYFIAASRHRACENITKLFLLRRESNWFRFFTCHLSLPQMKLTYFSFHIFPFYFFLLYFSIHKSFCRKKIISFAGWKFEHKLQRKLLDVFNDMMYAIKGANLHNYTIIRGGIQIDFQSILNLIKGD